MRKSVLVSFAAALAIAGCGTTSTSQIAERPTNKLDTSDIKINGDASDPANRLAVEAIADLQAYWAKEYPELYGEEYQPVAGGFYAVIPSSGDLPPCTDDINEISGNAFYCSTEDVVAWDAEGLLPDLRSRFGDFVIPVVMALSLIHI